MKRRPRTYDDDINDFSFGLAMAGGLLLGSLMSETGAWVLAGAWLIYAGWCWWQAACLHSSDFGAGSG